MKKICTFILISILFSSLTITSQENSAILVQKAEKIESAKKETEPDSGRKGFFLCFEPFVLVNTMDSKKSAPSPIIFPITGGIQIPMKKKLIFEPRLSLFLNYYLWDGEKAAPSEIENRTGTVLSLLLDLPFGTSLMSKKNFSLSWNAGPAILARFAFLSNGVKDSDKGESGTAQDDVNEINKWFWSNANFLYLTANINYLYHFNPKFAAGPEIRAYLPIGSLISSNGLNGAIICIGLKAQF